eukprot:SAG31_NODE_298_length_18125_cov_27.373350_20_plen_93_part_00
MMQLGNELEETSRRFLVTSGKTSEGSDPAVARSGHSTVPVISSQPAAVKATLYVLKTCHICHQDFSRVFYGRGFIKKIPLTSCAMRATLRVG